MRKGLLLLLLWLLVYAVAVRAFQVAGLQVPWPMLVLTLMIPVLVGFALVGPAGFLGAIQDAFAEDLDRIPDDRRWASADLLRTLGRVALAVGLVGHVAAGAASMHGVLRSGPYVGFDQLALSAVFLLRAPLFGFLLKAFFFDLLADGLEAGSPDLWEEEEV